MIKVEDSTLEEFESHRKILIDGTEKEIDKLVDLLRIVEEGTNDLTVRQCQFLHDFVHSLESACGW